MTFGVSHHREIDDRIDDTIDCTEVTSGDDRNHRWSPEQGVSSYHAVQLADRLARRARARIGRGYEYVRLDCYGQDASSTRTGPLTSLPEQPRGASPSSHARQAAPSTWCAPRHGRAGRLRTRHGARMGDGRPLSPAARRSPAVRDADTGHGSARALDLHRLTRDAHRHGDRKP